MAYFDLLMACIGVIAVLFLITQIVVPFYRGTPFLPILRNKSDIVSELPEARQQFMDEEVREELDATRRTAERLRARRTTRTRTPPKSDNKS
jgi:hypothetical protein